MTTSNDDAVREVERQQRAAPATAAADREGRRREPMSDRLYHLLAYFDTRDGTPMADLVRSAREGYERSGPDMGEDGAWDEFDALWARRVDVTPDPQPASKAR